MAEIADELLSSVVDKAYAQLMERLKGGKG